MKHSHPFNLKLKGRNSNFADFYFMEFKSKILVIHYHFVA